MRKSILITFILLLAAVQNWDKITGALDPAPIVSEYTGNVVMYGTSWCGYCVKARSLFKANGISFHEYDVEKSPIGRKQYEKLGGRGVPLIRINGKTIKGYDERQILAALASQ